MHDMVISLYRLALNALRMKQNGINFADNIFKLIFLYENCCILIQILLKFVSNYPVNNRCKPALIQMMTLFKLQIHVYIFFI